MHFHFFLHARQSRKILATSGVGEWVRLSLWLTIPGALHGYFYVMSFLPPIPTSRQTICRYIALEIDHESKRCCLSLRRSQCVVSRAVLSVCHHLVATFGVGAELNHSCSCQIMSVRDRRSIPSVFPPLEMTDCGIFICSSVACTTR